ncbi:capsular exopolysaccharide synthesis family protein [Geodermatophilus tzadiensis]|uniref:non-specific protein-tyrosine kinase n=1 Tax=Geodermatophilus tzadiensis TaxID=1137988 RepID=A0A2T0TUL3_9ACTN|nr:polysaccharide biosynthesis tyrosine autokinase [Geodermatophilus tzadiensis]PRY49349.1 capsular exopolysaccharide synthesis family protein [Geodermatophilus tzadiensis]
MGSAVVVGAVRRRWRWVVAAVCVCLLGAVLHTQVAAKSYRATAEVFFTLQYGDSASDLVQGATYTRNQVASFARLATTPAVLGPVVDDLGLDVPVSELAGRVQAAAPVDTVLVEITVTESSATGSARVANAVAASLADVVEDLAPEDAEGRPTIAAATVTPAEEPPGQASPDPLLDLAVGLAAGLLLGLALAWGRDVLDSRVRDADALREVTPLPVVGTLGVLPRGLGRRPVVAADPHHPQAESFRQLRTNVQFLQVPDASPGDRAASAHVVLTTSSLPGEGKSTVAVNLACALAETGARVLLVDADLRRPTVATALDVEGVVGLTTVLAGHAALDDVVQEWGTSGLAVLPSGQIPPNPAELLGSPAMGHLLEQVRARYDHVVIDTAPVLAVTDGVVLSRAVDGTLVIANASRVRRAQLAESLHALSQVGSRVLGVVLNQVHRSEDSYSYQRVPDAGGADPRAGGTPDGPARTPVPLPPVPAGRRG